MLADLAVLAIAGTGTALATGLGVIPVMSSSVAPGRCGPCCGASPLA